MDLIELDGFLPVCFFQNMNATAMHRTGEGPQNDFTTTGLLFTRFSLKMYTI